MNEQNMLMGDRRTIIDSDGTEKVKHVFRSLKLILTNFHSTLELKIRNDSQFCLVNSPDLISV